MPGSGSQLFDFGNEAPFRPRNGGDRLEEDDLEDESENLMSHASALNAWDRDPGQPSQLRGAAGGNGAGGMQRGGKKRAFDWADDDEEELDQGKAPEARGLDTTGGGGGGGGGRGEESISQQGGRGIDNPLERHRSSNGLSNPLEKSASRPMGRLNSVPEVEGWQDEDEEEGHHAAHDAAPSSFNHSQGNRRMQTQDSDILLGQSLQPELSLSSLGHRIDDEDQMEPPQPQPQPQPAAGGGDRPPIPGPAGLSSHAAGPQSARRDFNSREGAPRPQSSSQLAPVDLPLRKPRAAVRAHDPDFDAESWRKMLRDFDNLPAPGAPSDAGEGLRGGRLSTSLAGILASKQKTKVPMLRVFVKVITFNDDSADAVLKDPTAEIQACIHGSLLEEEGDSLAVGATLVLRKLTVFHTFNGRDMSLIVTPNNLVRCYPPDKVQKR